MGKPGRMMNPSVLQSGLLLVLNHRLICLHILPFQQSVLLFLCQVLPIAEIGVEHIEETLVEEEVAIAFVHVEIVGRLRKPFPPMKDNFKGTILPFGPGALKERDQEYIAIARLGGVVRLKSSCHVNNVVVRLYKFNLGSFECAF